MVEGDKWEMYIPSELAYGDRGSPPKIPGGSALIFQMEIIKINGNKKMAIKCDPATLENCNEKEAAFVTKMKSLSKDKVSAELGRLQNMNKGTMKAELSEWIQRRIFILKALVAQQNDEVKDL